MDPTTDAPPETPEEPLAWGELVDTATETVTGWVDGIAANMPNMVAALIVVVIAIVVGRGIAQLAHNGVKRMTHNAQLASLFATVVRLGALGGGLFVALGVMQLDKTVTSLLAGVGILGLALGFAVQEIAANFLSGVVMAVKRPFHLGDLIETNGHFGTVKAVDLRATQMRLLTGEHVTMPNKDVMSEAIVNFSRNGERRVDLAVGVSYGDDLDKAKKAVTEAVTGLPGQNSDKPVEVFYTSFGGSSIDMTVRFWIDKTGQADWLAARSGAIMAIKNALDSAEITIPFPIRTLDFGIVGGERLDQMRMSPTSLTPEAAQAK